MDFGNFPPLKYPTAYVSVDAIVFRPDDGKILTGLRRDDPWKGYLTLMFGGYVDPTDEDAQSAAVRETKEETGLKVQLTGFVGIYGPERFRHRLRRIGGNNMFFAEATKEPAHIRPSVSIAFSSVVVDGTLNDTTEQKDLKWLDIKDIVDREFIAFDHARALSDWLNNFYSSKRALVFLNK